MDKNLNDLRRDAGSKAMRLMPPNQTVQRIGASRFALRQIERQWRLAPIADLCVSQLRTCDDIERQHFRP